MKVMPTMRIRTLPDETASPNYVSICATFPLNYGAMYVVLFERHGLGGMEWGVGLTDAPISLTERISVEHVWDNFDEGRAHFLGECIDRATAPEFV